MLLRTILNRVAPQKGFVYGGTTLNVLDRFHIMQAMNKAIDEVRADEARRLKRDG